MTAPIIAAVVIALLMATIIKGAPPVPTSRTSIQKIIEHTKVGKNDRVVDLGAGDGRVVIAFAKAGAVVYGYEINPILVLLAQYKIRRAGVSDKAKVNWGDFWDKDLSSFNIVNVFGIGHIMKPLAKKLEKELRPGAKVTSNVFPIPGWREIAKADGVYLYIVE